MRRASFAWSPVSDWKNSRVPDLAMVPMLLTTSSRDMPMPLSDTVRVRACLSKETRILRSASEPYRAFPERASKRSLSAASEAFDISSLRKISLLPYKEWIMRSSSCLTSAWKPRVSLVAAVDIASLLLVTAPIWGWIPGCSRPAGPPAGTSIFLIYSALPNSLSPQRRTSMLRTVSIRAVNDKNPGGLVAHPSEAVLFAASDIVPLRFTGRAAEYFRIWIVNICLSIVTLGIYSAWAKVRRKRYFYGNTLLGDSAFEYLADPKAILKGRIVVVGGFAIYSLVGKLNPIAGLAMALVFLVVLPWLIVRASRFNAVNSAHRNVRFDFRAGYGEMARLLTLPIVLVPLTLGLLYPYYAYRKRRFFLEHSTFGTTPFAFDASAGAYYFVYLKAALMFVLLLAGSAVTLGIGALPFYIWFAAYRDGAVGRLTWKSTRLGALRFDCRWTTGGLFKLFFLNSLGVIATAGLLAPWAAVRTARYQLKRISLQPGGEIGAFIAAAQERVGAIGDEAGDLLGFDFGL